MVKKTKNIETRNIDIEKLEKKEKDKRFLTLVILFFPTIIIVTASMIPDIFVRGVIQFFLAVYQMVIIKNLLDNYYGY